MKNIDSYIIEKLVINDTVKSTSKLIDIIFTLSAIHLNNDITEDQKTGDSNKIEWWIEHNNVNDIQVYISNDDYEYFKSEYDEYDTNKYGKYLTIDNNKVIEYQKEIAKHGYTLFHNTTKDDNSIICYYISDKLDIAGKSWSIIIKKTK